MAEALATINGTGGHAGGARHRGAAAAAALVLGAWLVLDVPGVEVARAVSEAPAPGIHSEMASAAAAARRPVPEAPAPWRADGRMPAADGGAVRLASATAGFAVPEAEPSPGRPAPLTSPTTVLVPDAAEEMAGYFAAMDYTLERVRRGERAVPRVFAAHLPSDLARLQPTQARKRLFLRLALPLVLKANEEIRAQRRRLVQIRAELARGRLLDTADRLWLDEMAERYGVEGRDLDALIRRVDVIPPSLALAQSIQESGWGTSRFARRGNALYGQRTWSDDIPGLEPRRVDDPDFKVRAYRELVTSVRSYMRNLNTHPAYAALRARRAELRAADRPLDGYALAATLERYSEERGAYVEKLRALMAHNGLRGLDDARLAAGGFVRRVVPDGDVETIQVAYGPTT